MVTMAGGTALPKHCRHAQGNEQQMAHNHGAGVCVMVKNVHEWSTNICCIIGLFYALHFRYNNAFFLFLW
jgi:hypothetical protein